MRIFAKLIMDKAKQICFQNLKLLSRNAVKPKVGYNYYPIQTALIMIPTKGIEIFADELEEC